MAEDLDVCLEMSGYSTALPEMIANMNHGGQIATRALRASSIGIDSAMVVAHMLTLQAIYERAMYESWFVISALLQSNPALQQVISQVITDYVPAGEWDCGF